MKKIFLIIYIFATIIFLSTSSYAQIEEAIFSSSYLIKLKQVDKLTLSPDAFLHAINSKDLVSSSYPQTKLTAGLINATTSWSDIPQQIAVVSEKYSVLGGFTLGLLEGVISTSARAVTGGVDMATSVLPSYEKPLMEPEHKISYTNDGFKIKILQW